MKAIKILLPAFVICISAVACSDTKDCICTTESDGVQKQSPMMDWDGSCDKITADDLGVDALINPCDDYNGSK
ncbi:MAG: hypothetical protein IJ250_03905 [Bacteroidales bacterium]|nr:hypothetical protein [Bacteroidales bacterium]